jgi:hypothetical protein
MRRAWCSRILLTVFLLVRTTNVQHARCQSQLDARVNNLIAEMTLDEKVGQLNQVNVDKTNLEQAIAAGKVGSVLNAVGAAQTNKLQRLAIERSNPGLIQRPYSSQPPQNNPKTLRTKDKEKNRRPIAAKPPHPSG